MEIYLSEYNELMINRKNFYRFLGRLYETEVDYNLLNQLKIMRFPAQSGDKELDKGYKLLGEYVSHPRFDPITDLAVDFARVFLGAGIYEGTVASPYESVYTSPERLIMQDARDEVLASYYAKGLDKLDTLNVPEDHISLEFEFMAYLCQETQNYVQTRDREGVSRSLIEQMEFLRKHLENWIPAFCEDIEKCASTNFYIAVAKITEGFLRLERGILEQLIFETVSEFSNKDHS
ncbi:molecular chaperone TorD family protein [Robertmurraya massiliosenegalensis]|uniref:TorD/DmsD family molecular chaperone n=1 Tax=Robertmurraya TaxID=2837507 RepID=UPI0039A747B8